MGRRFTGCAEAREISLCQVDPSKGRYGGANPGSLVLMTKNRTSPIDKSSTTPPTHGSENPDMTPEDIAKAQRAFATKMFAMSEVSKAYYLTLTEDADQTAFLEKSAEDQTKIAETAKRAAADAAAIKEAAKAGKSEQVVALEKSLKDGQDRIAELEKRDRDRTAEAEIEKAAMDPAYSGYPGGKDAVVEMLKTANLLPEGDGRSRILAQMKSTATMARSTTRILGAPAASGSTTAVAKASAKISEIAKARGIPLDAATRAFASEAEFAEDYAASLAEEGVI